MGMWSSSNDSPTPTLTAEDRREFVQLDAAVRAGVEASKAVMAAGRALAVIRDRQLYRLVSPNWDSYIIERHGISVRRANQIAAAATALEAVEKAIQSKMGTTVPSFDEITERTARQLVGMDADQAAEAVIEAAASPTGITPASVRKAASKRRRKTKVSKVPRPRRFKVPGGVVLVSFNRKSNGSVLDALTAAMRQAEDLIEAENRQAEAA